MCFPQFRLRLYVFLCIDADSVYQVHIMEYVSYVGFATSSRAIVITHFVIVYIYIWVVTLQDYNPMSK